MTDNPSYVISTGRSIKAPLVQRVLKNFLAAGFEPTLGMGVAFLNSNPDEQIRFDSEWGPPKQLQKALVRYSNDEFKLGLGVWLKSKSIWVSLVFHTRWLLVFHEDALPTIGDTDISNINFLIEATHGPVFDAIGPYTIEVNLKADRRYASR